MTASASAIATFRERVEALARTDLDWAARLVAWAILLHADESGRAFPGSTALERLTGLSRRSLVNARARLGVAFDMERTGRDGANGRTAAYTFRADRCIPCTGASGSPVHPMHRPGASGSPPPVHPVHREEPIEEPMKDVRRAACAKRTSRRGTKAAASPEALEVIRLRHELLGGQAEATAPKVKAATRALEAGFAVPMIRRALEAIRAADRDGADERSLAAFCATRNRSFEYALRPDVLQRLLDEADAARPAPIRVVRPETTGPVILGPRKLA